MMQQPQPNPNAQAQQGIAGLPLQAVQAQKDVQQPSGLQQTPPQIAGLLLKKAMVEQDKAEKAAAANRNMLMQQAAQQPQGPMPVAQRLAQEAAQIEQQKAQQMAQMQRPAANGIDSVPVEFKMAGGGIVGFAGTEGSVVEGAEEPVEDKAPGWLRRKLWKQLNDAAEASDIRNRRMPSQNQRGDNLYVPEQAPVADRPSLAELQASLEATKEAKKDAPKAVGSAGSARTGISAAVKGSPANATGRMDWIEGAIKGQYDAAKGMNPEAMRDEQRRYMLENGGTKERVAGAEKAEADTRAAQAKAMAGGPDKWDTFLTGVMNAPKSTEGGVGSIMALGKGAEAMQVAKAKQVETALANDKELIALRNRVAEAKALGDDSAVKSASDVYDRALQAKTQQMTGALTAGVSYANTLETTKTRLEGIRQHSADLAQRYAAAKQAGDHMAKQELIEAGKRTAAALTSLDKDIASMAKDPMADKAELANLRAEAAATRKALFDSSSHTKGVTTPAAGATLQSAAVAEIERRAQGK